MPTPVFPPYIVARLTNSLPTCGHKIKNITQKICIVTFFDRCFNLEKLFYNLFGSVKKFRIFEVLKATNQTTNKQQNKNKTMKAQFKNVGKGTTLFISSRIAATLTNEQIEQRFQQMEKYLLSKYGTLNLKNKVK